MRGTLKTAETWRCWALDTSNALPRILSGNARSDGLILRGKKFWVSSKQDGTISFGKRSEDNDKEPEVPINFPLNFVIGILLTFIVISPLIVAPPMFSKGTFFPIFSFLILTIYLVFIFNLIPFMGINKRQKEWHAAEHKAIKAAFAEKKLQLLVKDIRKASRVQISCTTTGYALDSILWALAISALTALIASPRWLTWCVFLLFVATLYLPERALRWLASHIFQHPILAIQYLVATRNPDNKQLRIALKVANKLLELEANSKRQKNKPPNP